MSYRPVWLIKSRQSRRQRSHFAVFVPNAAHAQGDPNQKDSACLGTLIHVIGAPMVGFCQQFKVNFGPGDAEDFESAIRLGSVSEKSVTDPPHDSLQLSLDPLGWMDGEALRIPAPGASKNFLAPTNDTTNRRCQEWTMDYLRLLVKLDYIDPTAIDIAQAERDPPEHGIGLRSALERQIQALPIGNGHQGAAEEHSDPTRQSEEAVTQTPTGHAGSP